jgi:hypothetical protein
MGTLTIENRSLETPVLVPSVSSFETQLPPIDALRLQYTLREPISLISAYDISLEQRELIRLCKEFRRHGVLLLDSGGYESARISRYVRENRQKRWNFSKYEQIASEDIYDFVFSFDYFLEHDESPKAFSQEIPGASSKIFRFSKDQKAHSGCSRSNSGRETAPHHIGNPLAEFIINEVRLEEIIQAATAVAALPAERCA